MEFLDEEPSTPIDPVIREKISSHVLEILKLLGLDPKQGDLVDTPGRVAQMYADLFSGIRSETGPKMTSFANDIGYTSMVMVRDIPFYSMCSHHLIPFFGVGHIAYLPSDRIVGLSKLARALEFFSRRPQVQERITNQVADFLEDMLRPRGVCVVIEARHLCMEMRGVEKAGSLTVTSAHRGLFLSENGRETSWSEEFHRHISRSGSVPR